MSDYHLRAVWRTFDRPLHNHITWNDIEYSYFRGAAFPSLKIGLDFIDRSWTEYDRE